VPSSRNLARPVTVRLNEVMPAPGAVDWNDDGDAGPNDEWIELYNTTGRAVDISRWSIDLGQTSAARYRFPRRTVLQPGRYLVVYQPQSKLVLDDTAGQVRLLDASGRVVDAMQYADAQPDRSLSRDSDNAWTSELTPSPGQANTPPAQRRSGATPTPSSGNSG
jgi:hypothetical protein